MSVVNRRERELYVQTRTPRMKKYAEDLAKTQADKQKNYDDYIKERTANQTAVVPISNQSQALKPIEAPLPCNSVEPYTPDVFGLEDAAKDCRFEMIKIVREVSHRATFDVHQILTILCRSMQSQAIPKLLAILNEHLNTLVPVSSNCSCPYVLSPTTHIVKLGANGKHI
jgi:hypothetical protein